MLVNESWKWLIDVRVEFERMSKQNGYERWLSCPFRLCKTKGSRDECGKQYRRRYQLNEHMVLDHKSELKDDSISEYCHLNESEITKWKRRIEQRKIRNDHFREQIRASTLEATAKKEETVTRVTAPKSPRRVVAESDGRSCKVRITNDASDKNKPAVEFLSMPDLAPEMLDDFKTPSVPMPLCERKEFQPRPPKVTTTYGQYQLKRINFGSEAVNATPDPRLGSRKGSVSTESSSSHGLLIDLCEPAAGSFVSSDGYNSYSLGDDLSEELFAIAGAVQPAPLIETSGATTPLIGTANGRTSAEQSEELVVNLVRGSFPAGPCQECTLRRICRREQSTQTEPIEL